MYQSYKELDAGKPHVQIPGGAAPARESSTRQNTERHMIRDLQEEVDQERQRADEAEQRADSAEKRADSAEQSEKYARHQLDGANAIIAKYKARFGEL